MREVREPFRLGAIFLEYRARVELATLQCLGFAIPPLTIRAPIHIKKAAQLRRLAYFYLIVVNG